MSSVHYVEIARGADVCEASMLTQPTHSTDNQLDCSTIVEASPEEYSNNPLVDNGETFARDPFGKYCPFYLNASPPPLLSSARVDRWQGTWDQLHLGLFVDVFWRF